MEMNRRGGWWRLRRKRRRSEVSGNFGSARALRYNGGVRRFWRIFFNAITTISLVLAVAVSILWIRGVRRHDELLYTMIDPPRRTTDFYGLRSYGLELSLTISPMYYADAEQFKRTNPAD